MGQENSDTSGGTNAGDNQTGSDSKNDSVTKECNNNLYFNDNKNVFIKGEYSFYDSSLKITIEDGGLIYIEKSGSREYSVVDLVNNKLYSNLDYIEDGNYYLNVEKYGQPLEKLRLYENAQIKLFQYDSKPDELEIYATGIKRSYTIDKKGESNITYISVSECN